MRNKINFIFFKEQIFENLTSRICVSSISRFKNWFSILHIIEKNIILKKYIEKMRDTSHNNFVESMIYDAI